MSTNESESAQDNDCVGSSSHEKASDRHECICTSEKCRLIRDMLDGTGDVRSGPPIRLCFSKHPNFQRFWHRLCVNLKPLPNKRRELESGGDGHRFSICRHHYSSTFLEEQNGSRFTSLLSKEEASKLLYVLDPADAVEAGSKYIKSPNVSMDDLYEEVICMSSTRSKCAEARGATIAGNRSVEEWQKMESTLRGIITKKNEERRRDLSIHRADVDQQKTDRKLIHALREQVSQLKKQRQKDQKEIADLKKEMASMASPAELTEFIQRYGGLCRITIFDDDWHKQNTDAAHLLWGFRTYEETKQYVRDLFVDVKVVQPRAKMTSTDSPSKFELDSLSPFEKCLLTRLFFRRELPEGFIGLIFGRHRTRIGRILREWAPRWGKAGEQLSVLDISEEYLDAEEPDRSYKVGVRKVVNVDGTDIKIDEKRSDLTANRSTYGAKNANHSACGITWSTAGGLSFEHTPLFGARASEKALFQFWGSLGKESAPLEDWKDVAVGLSNTDKCIGLRLPTEDTLDYQDIEELVHTSSVFSSTAGAVDDDVLVTARPGGIARMVGVTAEASPAGVRVTNDSSFMVPVSSAGSNTMIGDVDSWFKELCAIKEAQRTTSKAPPLLSSETLKDQNEKALRGGVNSSGLEKLCQLEVQERLHQSYQAGRLKKNALSYYLFVSAEWRHAILKWMGSDLAPVSVECPTVDNLPKILLRLAKVPRAYGMLGDKGFDKTTRFNPCLNKV